MLLTIKNFICLDDVEIEVNDLTIIIGEQASGKSITSKLYFFLREVVSNEIIDSIVNITGLKSLQSSLKKEFSSLFPDYSWKNQDFTISVSNLIQKESGTPDILISHASGNGIKFSFSEEFKFEYKKITTYYKKLKAEREQVRATEDDELFLGRDMSPFRLFRNSIDHTNTHFLFEDVTYIPSGRSFFSTIRDNVFGFLSENIGIDPFLKSFGKYYEFAKSIGPMREEKHKESLAEFDMLSRSVLKGRFSIENKKEWIVSSDRRISVANASSGQQEALPLLLVLRQELMTLGSSGLRTIIVEEPEAHLFPVSQKAIVDLLFLLKQKKKNLNFLITTHSPYVLSCINNGILKAQGNVKVDAYFIANGTAIKIVDEDSGLINGEDLDKISTEIANEFYAALENT